MPKISDPNYFLPEIHALLRIRVLSSGRNKPNLIVGVCTTTGMKGNYVVKYDKGPEMNPMSSCIELIASFVGMELGLSVPEPVIVHISEEFVELLKGSDDFATAQKSIGKNFGCGFMEGFIEILKGQELSPILHKQAGNVFTFDIFISNSDRRSGKPNVLTDGNDLLVFDHELAFGFLLEIFKNPEPWVIRDSDLGWIKDHFFYPFLKGKKNDFDDFLNKFKTLDNPFWDKVELLIPKEWSKKDFDIIKNNLQSFIVNIDTFKQELNKILS